MTPERFVYRDGVGLQRCNACLQLWAECTCERRDAWEQLALFDRAFVDGTSNQTSPAPGILNRPSIDR